MIKLQISQCEVNKQLLVAQNPIQVKGVRKLLQLRVQAVTGVSNKVTKNTAQILNSDLVQTVAQDYIQNGQIYLEIDSNDAVSIVDAKQDESIWNLSEGQGEVIGLTLWLMSQKSKGKASEYFKLVQSLPQTCHSPMLWSKEELQQFLQGSYLLEQVEFRKQALIDQWKQISDKAQQLQVQLPQEYYNEYSFIENFQIVLQSSSYLPSIKCLALLPKVYDIRKGPKSDNCKIDYNTQTGRVTVETNKDYQKGDEIELFTEMSNADFILKYGYMYEDNPYDFVEYKTSLVLADRLYKTKLEILKNEGYGAQQAFPLYKDKIQLQLLSYFRLQRVQDTSKLAKVSFTKDMIIDELNEYEVLQLILSDFRTMLGNYKQTMDDDYRSLNQKQRSYREIMAIKQCINEKIILNKNIEMIRERLAPIRGVPTKKGLVDPNSDLKDIFQTIENIPNKPKQVIEGFMKWARGEGEANKTYR